MDAPRWALERRTQQQNSTVCVSLRRTWCVHLQAGYSEKLSSREATVPASAAAAAAADAGPFQQAAVPAFERLPASIAPPLHSPRAAPKAAPAADMFLSSKPIQRPAAAVRSHFFVPLGSSCGLLTAPAAPLYVVYKQGGSAPLHVDARSSD